MFDSFVSSQCYFVNHAILGGWLLSCIMPWVIPSNVRRAKGFGQKGPFECPDLTGDILGCTFWPCCRMAQTLREVPPSSWNWIDKMDGMNWGFNPNFVLWTDEATANSGMGGNAAAAPAAAPEPQHMEE